MVRTTVFAPDRLAARFCSSRSAKAASRPHAVAARMACVRTLSREAPAARSRCKASCVRHRTDEMGMLYPCEQSNRACEHSALRKGAVRHRSEEHTSELQSLMRISYAVFCLKKKKKIQ